MNFAFPQWRGFEFAPEGHLLDQLVDLSGPMGVAYERSVGFYKHFHAHDRTMIVLPRGSCAVKVRTNAAGAAYELDDSSLLIVPAGLEHEDEGLTTVFDTLALFPSPALLDQVAKDEGIGASRIRNALRRCQKVRRSRWLVHLLHEYFFARVVSRRESARTLEFFERQILVELLASALGTRGAPDRMRSAVSAEDVTGRALRYIEANLFAKLSLAAIARQAFASPSTLLRQFRRDTGKTPYGYVRLRRLEEARRLIESGTHPVGDIALLVGYENFGSFSTAFQRYFGRPPSSFRTRSGNPRGRSTARGPHRPLHRH